MTMINEQYKSKFQALFDEAIQLRDSGHLQESLSKLFEILGLTNRYDSVVSTVMGNIYWELEDLSQALECFQKAVSLKPKSELASLGLFHTFWDMKNFDAAHEEIRRFLSNLKPDEQVPEEYSRLLDEMQEGIGKAEAMTEDE